MTDATLRPRRRPQQERSRLLVEDVLEAAARVFASHGYAHATTNRIAEVAGVSIGSLYQYFPSKDAILVALTERHIADGTARLAPLLRGLDPQRPLDESLSTVTHAMVELHRRAPALHRVLVEECPRPPEMRARLDALFDAAVDAIAAFLGAHPAVTVADTRTAAGLVVQVVEAVSHRLVIHAPDADASAVTTETVRMLSAYLTIGAPGDPRSRTAGRRARAAPDRP